MPMRASLIAALVVAVTPASAAIELTPDNFDKEVFESGKSVRRR